MSAPLLKILLLMLMLFVATAPAQAQRRVDQLAATVNGEAITESDIRWALALKADAYGKPVTGKELSQMLDQIIDQRLLLSEAKRLPLDPTPAEIEQELSGIIKAFPNQETFYQSINAVGLTAEMLQQIVRQYVLINKYIDFRFRAFAIITEEEIQQYYDQTLRPKLGAQGEKLPEKPPDEIRNVIERILIEERTNNETFKFLENARPQADIVLLGKF